MAKSTLRACQDKDSIIPFTIQRAGLSKINPGSVQLKIPYKLGIFPSNPLTMLVVFWLCLRSCPSHDWYQPPDLINKIIFRYFKETSEIIHTKQTSPACLQQVPL